MIEPFYGIFLLRYFSNCEECKSQKLYRELFLVTNYLWNAICKHLLPRDLVNGHAVRIPDVLLVIGSGSVYGVGEFGGPFGENGKHYPRDGAENHLKASFMQLEEMEVVSVTQQGVTPQSVPSTVQGLVDRQVAGWLGRRAERTC